MRPFRSLLLAAAFCGMTSGQTPPQPTVKLTVLFPFQSNGPEGYVARGLVRGPDGNFYGSTTSGGAPPCRCGSVFRMTPDGQLRVLYSFTGTTNGIAPQMPMVFDKDGNLWGVSPGISGSAGRVFKITMSGEYTLFPTPLPGILPNGLVLATDGNFYGTTVRSATGDGTFFRVTPTGTVTLIRTFVQRTDTIANPSVIIQARDGDFYGTTSNSVFKLTATGTLTILVRSVNPVNGGPELAGIGGALEGVTQGADGAFYGATTLGFFRVTTDGAITAVLRYRDVGLEQRSASAGDGATRLTLAADGSLYGSARGPTAGTIFRISSTGQFQRLYNFPDANATLTVVNPEGGNPSQLVQGSDGWYGSAGIGGPTPPGQGGTIFKLAIDGGTGVTPPPLLTGNPLGEIQTADPNVDGVLNQNKTARGFLVGDTPWDDTAYPAFATLRTVGAMAADGLTPVILRVEVPPADAVDGGTVTFRLTEVDGTDTTPAASGTLGCIRDRSCASSGGIMVTGDLQRVGDRYLAFARLNAPADFIRPGMGDESNDRRLISFIATLTRPGYQDRGVRGSIVLVRPPVVLLHGLWSNERTWNWNEDATADRPAGLQKDPRFLVTTFDYEATHAQHFTENLGLQLDTGFNVPRAAVLKALEAYRARSIAATRVDFIGHSMGGLLGRYYGGEYTTPQGIQVVYKRADNFYGGDIHKLITLDTPHRGSDIANALVDSSGTTDTDWGKAFELLGCMICGAVADLRVGSQIILALPTPDVPSHAIVGIGAIETFKQADATLVQLETLGVLAPGQAAALLAMTRAGLTGVSFLEEYFLGGAQHDAIVSASSQTGGLPAEAITFFNAEDPVSNPRWSALHFTVTHDSRISKRVIELLHAPVDSLLFGRFRKNQ